jgi:hypothetical protein
MQFSSFFHPVMVFVAYTFVRFHFYQILSVRGICIYKLCFSFAVNGRRNCLYERSVQFLSEYESFYAAATKPEISYECRENYVHIKVFRTGSSEDVVLLYFKAPIRVSSRTRPEKQNEDYHCRSRESNQVRH